MDKKMTKKKQVMVPQKLTGKQVELSHELTVESFNPVQKQAYALAIEVKGAMDSLGDVYRRFTEYVRQHCLSPVEVTSILKLAGFHKVVASKIKTVASLSDDAYNQYATRQIGFNAAVDVGREIKRAANSGPSSPKRTVLQRIYAMASKELHRVKGSQSACFRVAGHLLIIVPEEQREHSFKNSDVHHTPTSDVIVNVLMSETNS